MATKDLELEQLDVKTTFLHGDIGEGHLRLPTGRLLGDEGGMSPCMPTEEKILWLKTTTEDVVPEVQLLHPAAWSPPVRFRPMHVHSVVGRRVLDLSDPICRLRVYCRKQSSTNRKAETEPSRQIRDEGTWTSPPHSGHEDRAKSEVKNTMALPIRLHT